MIALIGRLEECHVAGVISLVACILRIELLNS